MSTERSRWFEFASVGLNALLITAVVLLIIKNRALDSQLRQILGVNDETEQLELGEKLTKMKVQSVDGDTAELSIDGGSRKYILFVLSTTCPYCERNLVSWNRIVHENVDQSVGIYGLSISPLFETQYFFANKDVRFMLFSVVDTSSIRENKMGSVPQTIIVNGDRTVEGVWSGVLTEDMIREILEKVKS